MPSQAETSMYFSYVILQASVPGTKCGLDRQHLPLEGGWGGAERHRGVVCAVVAKQG